MSTFVQDLRYGLRSLLRAPGFTAVAVLTLAIGIGANSAVFSAVYALLFDPLPFVDGRRIVAVWERAPGGNDHNEVTPANFRDFKETATSFEHLVAHAWWPANLTGGIGPERVQGFRVSTDYFAALGIEPMLGRSFAPGDDAVTPARVVVISHALWQRRFGGDSGVIGQTLAVNDIDRTIVGVLPPGVRYPTPGDLWQPLAMDTSSWENRVAHFLLVTGKLRPGATAASAQAELATIAARLSATYAATNTGWGVNIRPLERDIGRQLEPVLVTLFAAVGFVLLIACVNVANLLLARGTGRRRELALRATLGARRSRLVRQLLTESAILGVLGAAAGMIVAVWCVQFIASLFLAQHQQFIPGFQQLGLSAPVLVFTAFLALATTLLFGLLPSLRTAGKDLHNALQEGERSGGGHTRHRLRRVLVAAEVALALVLLVSAGLMVRSMRHLLATSPGFDPDGIALTSVVLPIAKYDSDAKRSAFFDDLFTRLEAYPGVRAAGGANVTPLCGCNQTTSFTIVGREPVRRGEEPDVGWRVVTPGYFTTLGVALVQGRGILATDDPRAPQVVVVNQTLARRYFPEGALGQRLRLYPDTMGSEIVGIVQDMRHAGPTQPPAPEIYVSAAQYARVGLTIAVRGTDPAALLSVISSTVQAVDPNQSVADQMTMGAAFSAVLGPQRVSQQLLVALGAIALLLAGVGIYAVIAQLVGERTREIGIRVALGGDRGSVIGLVLRQGLQPALWGLAVGAVLSLGVTQLIKAQLYGVSPADPITLIIVAAVLMIVAIVATYAPALRATRIEPMTALRTE